MSSSLSMQHVSKSYQPYASKVDIFDDVSMDFVQGNSYAIMGASGSGKSTTIHLLAGIDTPTSGDIFFADTSISSFSPERATLFFQKNISLVFQQAALFAELTVLENVMLKAILTGQVTEQSYQHAQQLLQEVGLLDKAQAYPAMLSGGQQQRIAILRAIFIIPEFLLVDEPTGNLDEQSGDQVIDLLLHYHKKYGMGLIMSTHNQKIAHRMQTVLRVENKKLLVVNV
ncbi:MAG: ABC transporter ATP-binding protein [Candidatus Dependentiae bacterium]|nr:ABC transporter ATP-binding protein [Candidatus Dependentiae bacterium]